MEINFNSLTVDANGRTSFSGLGSGVDFQDVVDSIIAVRRIPIDRLEARILDNTDRKTAFTDFRALLNGLNNALANLRGAVSIDNTTDAFQAKSAFASTSRTDGSLPAAAGNLMGVSVTNAAALGSHTVEILRVAAAHKVMSDSVTDDTAAAGVSGDFTVNGQSTTLSATDTLRDIRDRINSLNTGTTPTGVTASIIDVSATDHVLVLTADTTGQTMTLADTSGTPLESLGVLTAGGAFSHELQIAQTARVTADGLLDEDRFESEFVASDTAALSGIATGVTFPASFDIVVGGNTVTVSNILGTDTLQGLRDKINNAITGSGGAVETAGTNASLLADGAGFRLVITNTSTAAISLTDTGGLLADLGVDNKLVIERQTNTINDLFTGITLTLFQAEEGTTVRIDLERDLTTVNTQLQAFVDAYNAVKVSINTHSQVDATTGVASTSAGVLFGNSTLSTVEQTLARILGSGTEGVSSDFSILALIGVDFVDNATLTDPLFEDTLVIDQAKLSEALLNNPDDVRRLFAFDFSASDPRVTLLGFNGQTAYNAAGYVLNVNHDDQMQSGATTIVTTFATTDADTNGPAEDGISAIVFDQATPDAQAFRYSYESTAENLTVVNLTTGATETVDVTSLIDTATGVGEDLAAGETVAVNFATLGVTITLSGDNSFTRGAAITDGTLDTTGIGAANGGIMAGGAVTTPVSGMNKATIDALVAAGAFDQATGLLTLNIGSTGAGESHFNTAAGILFELDGSGTPLADISATDLDDAGAHTIGIYVNDGAADVLVGTIAFTTLSGSTGVGNGNITIDLGTGLLAEAATVTSDSAPMSNYLTTPALVDGTFEVRDKSNTLLGSVNYLASDSILTLASKINSAGLGVTASVVASGGAFSLNVVDANHDTLTFNDTVGTVMTQLNMTNVGTGVFSANVGGDASGVGNGTVSVTGSTLTVTSPSGAEGLKVLFTGTTDVSAIQLDFTVGVASQVFEEVVRFVDPSAGIIDGEVDTLDDQNENAQNRIDGMLVRLELERQRLLDRFLAMESALAKLASIRETITQLTDALSQQNN